MLEVAVKKVLPDFTLEVDFTLSDGILVLFGPSGAGKTTVLQSIAGLSVPDYGLIKLNNRVFFSAAQGINVPARLRRVGYVFQEYALFPHMTVKQNAMYGIKGCKGTDGQYKLSVLDVMEMLKITHLQDRYPVSLSGGEKQRVALARALMTEPDLLLLDEPLSALDDKTRRQLRGELKELQRRWQIPFIIVTHDRTELNYLADVALFLSNGKPYRAINNPRPINKCRTSLY